MGELGTKLGFDELSGGAAGISRALLAEFIGNLLLNLFGCGACVNIAQSSAAPDIVLIALAFGLAVFAVVSAIGHVSGGHVNPAVTAGLASAGRVKPARAVLYVVAQCAGAAAGSGLLKALTPERAAAGKLGVTALGSDVTPLQGFGIEFFLGFVLVFVVCGVCDPNKPDGKSTAPLAIGMTVTLGHLLAVDYTGSAMNPARSFGSALVANDWANHWVYWAGPVAGGVAGALLYVHGFSAPPVDSVAPPRYRPVAADDKERAGRLAAATTATAATAWTVEQSLKRLDGGKAEELA